MIIMHSNVLFVLCICTIVLSAFPLQQPFGRRQPNGDVPCNCGQQKDNQQINRIDRQLLQMKIIIVFLVVWSFIID
jgi:hypothetical protein